MRAVLRQLCGFEWLAVPLNCLGCTAEGLTQRLAAIRAAEVGNQCGSRRWPDPRISAKSVQHRREGRGIGVFEVEGLQDEPAWC